MNNHAVFIKKEIWGLNISCEYRCLLSHIDYYTKNYGYCTTSNIQLALSLNCTDTKIKRMLSTLKKLGYISIKTKRHSPAMWEDDQTPYSERYMKCLILDGPSYGNTERRLSEDDIERAKSARGGFKNKQIDLLGVGRNSGWKKRALGRFYPRDIIDKFISMSDIY